MRVWLLMFLHFSSPVHQQSGVVKVPLSPNDKPGQPGPVEMYSESAFNLAHEYFDFRFQGRALQCGDEEMCHKFEAGFEWVGFMSAEEQNQYKYVIDIDGNGWSGRFHRFVEILEVSPSDMLISIPQFNGQ